MPELSDAEVICGFMEPRLDPGWRNMPVPLPQWWYWENEIGPGFAEWHPRMLTLDALRLVEEKLYTELYGDRVDQKYRSINCQLWHLTAEQKIAALAEVIRGIKC